MIPFSSLLAEQLHFSQCGCRGCGAPGLHVQLISVHVPMALPPPRWCRDLRAECPISSLRLSADICQSVAALLPGQVVDLQGCFLVVVRTGLMTFKLLLELNSEPCWRPRSPSWSEASRCWPQSQLQGQHCIQKVFQKRFPMPQHSCLVGAPLILQLGKPQLRNANPHSVEGPS